MKKRIFKLFLLGVIGLCSNLHILAQSAPALPGKCEASLPKILNKELISEDDVNQLLKSGNWGQSSTVSKYWTVYSDRSNNETYNSASTSSGRYTTLEFNQPLRIAKIQGNFALVYQEEVPSASNLQINKGKSFGWVPMDHLLLWNSCPTNKIGIYNKALPVVNIDEYARSKEHAGKVYKNPTTKANPLPLQTGMDFYFVMKYDEKSQLYLLAKECNMNGYSGQVLYGWVSKASYVSWNQRSCLEPNWDPEAAESMKNKNTNGVSVFRKSNMSDQACTMPLGRTNDVGNAPTKYRMYPDEMRYPLLDKGGESSYKVTAFATPDGKGHVQKMSAEKHATSINQIRENALQEASIINLIVVIDGTSSMKNFYEPTQQIIQKANDFFSKETMNKVRVGVVIYRDYPDGTYCTEHVAMTSPNSSHLSQFLKTGGKYGVKSVAKSATEALYKGLEVALDANKMGYTSNQSNLMFVIGDCGNDPEDSKCLSTEAIVNKCVANKIQLSAFQVFNGTTQAYKLFRSQMNQIIRESLNKQYGVGKINGMKAGWKELPNGYEFKTNLDNAAQFYIGNTRNAKNGEIMPVSTLYELVKDSYIQFAGVIERRKGALVNFDDLWMVANETSVSDRTASASVTMHFIESVFDKSVLERVKKQNMIMAFEGYTSQKDDNSGYDYWKPVIYVSDAEFRSMMKNLQPVMAAAAESSTDRKPYLNAMKALTRIMIPDITESQMDSKSVTEIMAMVAGLPVTSEALQGRTLKQLGDNQVVKQEEFDNLIANFKNKYAKLDRIKDDGYKFSITRNNTRWYWIPVEDLP